MRYRLRTLLIVVTLVGVLMGRVAYLKERADYHRREVHSLIPRIAMIEREREDIIGINIRKLANIGPASRDLVRHDNGLSASVGTAKWTKHMTDWQAATSHQILANRYEAAIYRPWLLVSNDPMRR